jgi:hypothetical protein
MIAAGTFTAAALSVDAIECGQDNLGQDQWR